MFNLNGNMKKLNIVQVGVGHDHAHDAIDFLRNCKEINLLGYVKFSSEEDIYQAHKERYSGVKSLSIDEVLAFDDLDAVFIEVDDRYLTEYATIFIERNIPVQLDKPGSQDKESFIKLFKLAKAKNVPIHMGYMYRYNPAIKKAKEIVKSSQLGKINYIELDMSTFHTFEKRKWLANFEGGMMNFLGCHLIDIMYSLQGDPDEIITLNTTSEEGVGEDIGEAKFKYGNYYSRVYTSSVAPGSFQKRYINIYLERGSLKIQPIELFNEQDYINVTLVKEENGKEETLTFPPFKRYDEMYYEFFDIVNENKANPYSYEYEINLHNLILKACSKRR